MTLGGQRHVGKVISLVVGILLGLGIYKLFLVPDFTDSVTTKTTVETKYVETTIPLPFKDFVVVKIPSVPILVKDTVINDVVYPVNTYSGVERTFYGNFNYKIETAGYLRDFQFKPEFEVTSLVPVTTVSTNKETLRTIHPKGFYVGGGMSSNLTPYASAHYLNNKSMFSATYGLDRVVSVGVAVKIF